jgi:sugar lactone lactonase YvrE
MGELVDHLGNVYVADSNNNRITFRQAGSKEGRIVIGENGKGQKPNQFNSLGGLSFDRQGNLYVVDVKNNRVQKFDVDSD